jgi:hypothetical protein
MPITTNVSSTGQWFSLVTPISSTNKTDRHDITEKLLKVALSTIIHPIPEIRWLMWLRMEVIKKVKASRCQSFDVLCNVHYIEIRHPIQEHFSL